MAEGPSRNENENNVAKKIMDDIISHMEKFKQLLDDMTGAQQNMSSQTTDLMEMANTITTVANDADKRLKQITYRIVTVTDQAGEERITKDELYKEFNNLKNDINAIKNLIYQKTTTYANDIAHTSRDRREDNDKVAVTSQEMNVETGEKIITDNELQDKMETYRTEGKKILDCIHKNLEIMKNNKISADELRKLSIELHNQINNFINEFHSKNK